MPIAVVQEWPEDETDRSTTNYDALHARLMQGEPPDGFLLHTAGFAGHRFRIFEVWQSREQYDRFVEERLMPLLREVTASDTRRPELTIYELHGFAVAPAAAAAPGV